MADPLTTLPCGVMVARRILVPPVRVRILPRQLKERAKSLRFSSFFIFIPPRNVKNCNFDTNLIQLSRNAWFIKIHNRIKNRYENYHWVSRVYVIEC